MSHSKRVLPAVHVLHGRVSVPDGASLGAARMSPAGRVFPLPALGVQLTRGGLYEVHITIIDLGAPSGGRGTGAN
jgi:hypothetical protein